MNYFEWRKLVDRLRHWSTDQLIDWPTWRCKWPARLTLPRCQGVKVSRLSQHCRVGCCILFAYHIRGKCDMEMFCVVCPEKHLMHTLSHISWHWNGSNFSHQITPWFGQTALLDMDHVLCCWLINCRPRRKCLAETHTLRGLMFCVVCKQINWTATVKSFSAN